MDLKTVSHSPHLKHRDDTSGIMLDVIIALLPAAIWGIVLFGPRAIALIFTSIVSAILAEYICCKIMKKKNSIGNLSAIVTGLLLGMNLPATLPLYMAAIGSAVAIVVVKMMFGGLGQNFANPAIVGRIVLMVSFTAPMTNWIEPFTWFGKSADIVSAATPLSGEEYKLLDLFFGKHGGCIGETGAIFLLIGGVYLVLRRVITPTVPLAFIGTVAALSLAFGMNPLSSILSGGLMLGAIFMATDYVTSPSREWGKFIFGIGCGILTILIRKFGSLPEGVSYAILIMNLLVPHIERLTKRKPFGWEAKKND